MEYSTVSAIKQIKSHSDKSISINGKQACPLQAMSYAFRYHTLDITENPTSLDVSGLNEVETIQAYLLK